MLATSVPRDIVLQVINTPYYLKSSNLTEAERAILIKGFIKGFQASFYVCSGLMAASTVAAFVLIKHIPLATAHSKAGNAEA
jgi:hypothetical protein